MVPMNNLPEPATDTSREATFQFLRAALRERIIAQDALVDRLLIALLADGHLLVEGAPGLAKTTAIKALAGLVEASFHRVQFTPDLLPADLTGTEVYRAQDGSFAFQRGPLFHNVLLADEINRAPPKVQSALLEAMAERQITVGAATYALPALFLVMATQNPIEQEGTYPLPEAQLDVAADVSTLLRRLAIQRHGRIPVAGLTGERWRSFLDGSGGAGGFAKISDALLKAPYQETDDSTVADLLAVTERWIRAGTRGEGAVGSISAIKVLVKKLRADAKSALARTFGKGRDPGGLVASAMDCLERACAESNAHAARQALLAWGATIWPEHPPAGLKALGTRLGKPETIAEIHRLEHSLYGGDPSRALTWTGTALLSNIRALKLSASARDEVEQSSLPPLHPASGAVCDA